METGVSDNFPTGRANIAQFHLTPRHGKGGSFLDRLSRLVCLKFTEDFLESEKLVDSLERMLKYVKDRYTVQLAMKTFCKS